MKKSGWPSGLRRQTQGKPSSLKVSENYGPRLRAWILNNGHSRQIRENCELLVRIWRGQSHFSQKWPLANLGESESPRNTAWRMLASLASLTHFQKWPFWWVLEFAKNGKFLASTRIRSIRRGVAIAYSNPTSDKNFFF